MAGYRNQTYAELAAEMCLRLNQAQTSVRIFAGEGSYRVYSNQDVVEALRKAYQRGVKIQIILGPVMSACRKGERLYSSIVQLALEGVIELYQRSRRLKKRHYHIYDSRLMLVQAFHTPLKNPIPAETKTAPDEIKAMIEEFSRSIEEGRGPEGVEVKRVRQPDREFVLALTEEIDAIVDKAPARFRGREYYDLDVEELWSLAREVRCGDEKASGTSAVSVTEGTAPEFGIESEAIMGPSASPAGGIEMRGRSRRELLRDSLLLILLATIVAQLIPSLILGISTLGKAQVIEIAVLGVLTSLLGLAGLGKHRTLRD